jgi:hypothetical protein
MEDPDDLQVGVLHPVQDDVLPLSRDLATGKEIIAPTATFRIGKDFFELLPERVEVALFLFRSPVVGAGPPALRNKDLPGPHQLHRVA